MAQNKSVTDQTSNNQAVVDLKPQNNSTVDLKPQNDNFTNPIETEQQYTVIYEAGQWMGMYDFTYTEGGTVVSPKSP